MNHREHRVSQDILRHLTISMTDYLPCPCGLCQTISSCVVRRVIFLPYATQAISCSDQLSLATTIVRGGDKRCWPDRSATFLLLPNSKSKARESEKNKGGGETQGRGKHTINPLPPKRFWTPHLWYDFPPPFVHAMSFSSEERTQTRQIPLSETSKTGLEGVLYGTFSPPKSHDTFSPPFANSQENSREEGGSMGIMGGVFGGEHSWYVFEGLRRHASFTGR